MHMKENKSHDLSHKSWKSSEVTKVKSSHFPVIKFSSQVIVPERSDSRVYFGIVGYASA